MKKILTIGVTGGIGSGKSSAIAYFKQKGFPVFSCDKINAKLLEDENYIKILKKHFPDCVIEGKVDKNILSKEIFSSEEKRNLLQSLAHPAILERLFSLIDGCEGLSFSEVPLLFESNLMEKFDKILVIIRPKDDRISALQQRDNTTKEKILEKFASQFDYEKALNDGKFRDEKYFLIFNNGSISDLQKSLDEFLKTIL